MFPKRKFIAFCKQNNIDISDWWTVYDEITIKFKQTNMEHITSTPPKPIHLYQFQEQGLR